MVRHESLRLLLRSLLYLRPFLLLEAVALICSVLIALVGLVQPWASKILVDDVLIGGGFDKLRLVCLLILSATACQLVLGTVRSLLFSIIGEGAVRNLRIDLFRHVLDLPLEYMYRRRTGEVLSSFMSDSSLVQGLYTGVFADLITDSLKLLVVLGAMMIISPKLTLASVLCIPVYALVLKIIIAPIRRSSDKTQTATAMASGELQEGISSIRDIRSLGAEDRFAQRVGETLASLLKQKVSLSIRGSLTSLGNLVAAIGSVLVIWWGGSDVISGQLEMGKLVAFIAYFSLLFGPVGTYVSIATRLQISLSGAKRVFDLLDAADSDENQARVIPVARDQDGGISISGLWFSYPGSSQPAIRGIDLKIEPGDAIALVGSSGAGKTTLFLLILGYLRPQKGMILFNGIDISRFNFASYRKQFGVVFQDPVIFHMSIRDNIMIANPSATAAQVREALRLSQCDEFIESLPNGVDTLVGERGMTLSGGQRQRLAIARVLVSDPRIVLFDEATSALDYESELLVQKAMKALLCNRTSIIIAHRVGSLRQCSRVIVMDQGSVVEQGSPEELTRTRGAFWRLTSIDASGAFSCDGIPPVH